MFWFGLFDSEKEMSQCPPDRFVEISAQWIIAEKFNRESGRADKRTEIPRELCSKEKIAGQPTQQNGARGCRARSFFAAIEQPPIRDNTGKRNHKDVCQ